MGDIVNLLKKMVKNWQEDKASQLAAALSYYTIFSLPPLMIISLAIAGRFYDRQVVKEQILDQTGILVGDTGSKAIAQILENASNPSLSSAAAIISVIVLLFAASGVFTQLQDAMDIIWDVQPKPGRGIMGTIKDRFFSFMLVVGVGILLVVLLILSTVLSAATGFVSGLTPGTAALASSINFVVSFSVVTLFFALIFKVIPDVKISWRDVWLGAVATALLFTIGKWAIGFYLGRSAPSSTYGAAGSLIVLLLWVYYSAQILFLGAEFTQVYANRFGHHIRPDESAVYMPGTQRNNQEIKAS